MLFTFCFCCCPLQQAGDGPSQAPRIFTFGIGPFCNHYFLKQLSVQGRGMFDVASRAHGIQVSKG